MEDRVVTTPSLIALAVVGQERGMNRQLCEDALEMSADPAGLHLLTVVLPFHNGKQAKQGPHHRCQVFIKEKNTDEPAAAFIDVPVERFEALVKADDFLKTP